MSYGLNRTSRRKQGGLGAGHSPWFRMWSRKSLSVANLLEQWEHWKRCSGVEWAEQRGLKTTVTGRGEGNRPKHKGATQGAKGSYTWDLEPSPELKPQLSHLLAV